MPYTSIPNRTLCDILDNMRKCVETLNFSYMNGLIEEAQVAGSRMEAALWDQKDFKRAEELGQCRIIYIEPQDVRKIIPTIIKNVKEIKAKRLVIDSITLISEYSENALHMRENLARLFNQLKNLGVTTLVTSEVEEGSQLLSRNGIEEFLVDAVIVLKVGIDVVGGKPRSLLIKKMRRTNHDLNTHPFEITDRGITLVKQS